MMSQKIFKNSDENLLWYLDSCKIFVIIKWLSLLKLSTSLLQSTCVEQNIKEKKHFTNRNNLYKHLPQKPNISYHSGGLHTCIILPVGTSQTQKRNHNYERWKTSESTATKLQKEQQKLPANFNTKR